MTKDEALDLALDALKSCGAGHITDGGNQWHDEKLVDKAITAIKQARALDKMAENAIELGLDYEPVTTLFGSLPVYDTPPVQEPVSNASAWFALVMNAAAELEDASHCLRDEDAKRVAISGAKHYRDAAKALYTTPPAQPAPVQEPVAVWELFADGWDSIADPEWMETLPVGTKLYTTPSAAPVQKPVAWYDSESGVTDFHSFKPVRKPNSPAAEWLPLYATPPAAQRQWVGLTQQDIDIAFDDTQEGGGFNEFAHAIEAKLKEKNT